MNMANLSRGKSITITHNQDWQGKGAGIEGTHDANEVTDASKQLIQAFSQYFGAAYV